MSIRRGGSRSRRPGAIGLLAALLFVSFLAAGPAARAEAPVAEPAPPAQAAADRRSQPPSAPPGAVSESLVFENIPIVITASRHEQKASEAPATVAIITAEEIERYGYRTLAEALQHIPGLYINYDRNYTYIGVRGFARPGDYNSRVQMQINGHPMNDNIWDYSAVGEDQSLDMAMVERIEVVYGPGSALYGSNALLATINVITRQPENVQGGQAALEGGSFGRGQARVTYGGAAGAWKMAGSLSALDSGGDDLYFPEYDALAQNGGIAEGTDFEKAYRFYGRMDRGPFVIQASSLYRVKGIPTGAFFTVFNDDATRTYDVRNFVDLQFRKSLRENLDLLLRGSFDEYRYWATYRYDAGGGSLVDNTDRSTGRWFSQEAQLDYRPSQRHHLSFGQGFVRNFDASIENFDNDPTVVYADVNEAFSEYSVYAQHEFVPTRPLRLTTGVRYDDYSTFGSKLSPRFALVFAPGDTWRLRAMAGRAFRAPNIYELFYSSFNWLPGLSLDPEVVSSYEVSMERKLGARFDVRVSLYRERIRDLITLTEVSPGVVQFMNLDRAVTRGAEAALRARFGNGASGYFSYSYMDAEDQDGQTLTNYPPSSYKAGFSLPFGKDRWSVGTDMQYYEERVTLLGTRSPDIFVTNVNLVAPLFHRKARLNATLFNLFDREYGLPASSEHQDLELIPQDGRAFVLRMLWNF